MKSIRHVAVATDFSSHSREAARLAFAIAKWAGADLTVIHAHEPIGSHYPGSAALLPELIVDQIEQASTERIRERLEELQKELERGVPSSEIPKMWLTVATGSLSEAICTGALEAAADVLVIGSRGKSQIASWLLGSVVREVAATAHCPVLVTKGSHGKEDFAGFANVSVGIDHTELSKPLIKSVLGLTCESGHLSLVNAWNFPAFVEQDATASDLQTAVSTLNAEAIAWEAHRLEALRDELGLGDDRATLRVELGKAAAQLLEHAASTKADLIALGSHARASLPDRVLGTTAERVLRHSEVPVLMLPASSLPRARTAVREEMADFEELNDRECKSYLVVAKGGKAMIVDPLLENVEHYLDLISGRELELVYVVDTQLHADHISGGPRLAEKTGAEYVVHTKSGSACTGRRVAAGEYLELDKLRARVLYTPGHAADAITLAFPDRLLTGDFLLLGDGGAGRTDLPGGDPGEHWDSLAELRHFAPETLVFPGHDYNGRTFSTLAEERVNNPRLAPRERADYVAWLAGQDLGPTDWMSSVIAANRSGKQTLADIQERPTKAPSPTAAS